MKRSRFSETQIVSVLKEAERGIIPVDLCRKHGMSCDIYIIQRNARNTLRFGHGSSYGQRLPESLSVTIKCL